MTDSTPPVDALLNEPITASGEVRNKGGRPPGAKNLPKDDAGKTPNSRPSKPPVAVRNQQQTIDQAVASMESIYWAIGQFATMFAPATGAMFETKIPELQEKNKQAFKASPTLANNVANMGAKTGTLGFFGANLLTLAPLVAMGMAEFKMQRYIDADPGSQSSEGPGI